MAEVLTKILVAVFTTKEFVEVHTHSFFTKIRTEELSHIEWLEEKE